jgi:CRISPR-associated protein Cmr3
MTIWIIEPCEPLLVRDGRPFNRQPGVMANTLPFPFPSTTAGAARNRAGTQGDVFTARGDLATLLRVGVRGPLLVEFTDIEQWRLLVPAPGDALLLEHDKLLQCRRLQPLRPPDDARMTPFKKNDGKAQELELWPVGPVVYDPARPAKGQPAFWHWEVFENWLLHPENRLDEALLTREELGLQALPQEERVHVALERGMMVAREGGLFETRGLEFLRQSEHLEQSRRLALWLAVEDGSTHYKLEGKEGLANLGGEGRLVSWKRSNAQIPPCPPQLRQRIIEDRACRLILLTPAYFRLGYLPDIERLARENAGSLSQSQAQPTVRAALVQRPQVVSGWDVNRHSIKPTRRLAPAGSVFFLKFPDQATAKDIEPWIERLWMRCISDNSYDRRTTISQYEPGEETQDSLDGFGLAVLGSWDGKPRAMPDQRGKEKQQ